MTETKLLKITHQGQLELPFEIVNNLQVKKDKRFSDLWQKIDDLGDDYEQLSMSEITAIVKEVRNKLHKY